MAEFRSALEDCLLYDVGYTGRWFTWERGRFASKNIRERLDKSVPTPNWLHLFPDISLEHLSHSFSDHCPLLIDTMDPTDEILEEILEVQLGLNFEADK
ncbi:hypothetical protein Gorai_019509 [Gossypium raimondii]|uniref:Endonuclease/exonuclease/phosphatase domain-containing protein n=1 Tax=Gossypium raimondii TaxID=29730 RepID=A0A7J8PNJ3_GOSRA|nr:hypothetical protein [Gossypium raimondii]